MPPLAASPPSSSSSAAASALPPAFSANPSCATNASSHPPLRRWIRPMRRLVIIRSCSSLPTDLPAPAPAAGLPLSVGIEPPATTTTTTTMAKNPRFIPLVEEKSGFWVLKPEHRAGINPAEKIKLEKDPMKWIAEGGIKELAQKSMEEIDSSKEWKDDVDTRLKWAGLFHRRKHQYGRFMMRLRLPNGVTTAEQMQYLGRVVERYGDEGCIDITTRQNWQIRGLVLADVPEVMDGLAQVGLGCLQSGMDNVRNPVGNPLAGIDPHEIVDTRPFNAAINDFITDHGRGNPSITNLPRKWNVCVVGSHDLYEHPHINDLAYVPARAVGDGRRGFHVLVGGFFSPKRVAEALPLDAWVPEDDVVAVCQAMLEAYRDLGTRGNRQRTRMMWLIDELGMEAFRAQVAGRMPRGRGLERASAGVSLVDPNWRRRSYLGAHPQKQAGLCYVGLHVPVGRLRAAQMLDLARIAHEYSSTRHVRLTVEQNLVLPDVPAERLPALLCEPLLQQHDRLSPSPPPLLAGLVACTGSQFCGQAIIETKARALRIAAELGRTVVIPRPVRMHWTGCPNSCGQVQVADIGFMGCMTRDQNNRLVEAVDIFLGPASASGSGSGSGSADSHLGVRVRSAVPCSHLVPVVQQLLVDHFGARLKSQEDD